MSFTDQISVDYLIAKHGLPDVPWQHLKAWSGRLRDFYPTYYELWARLAEKGVGFPNWTVVWFEAGPDFLKQYAFDEVFDASYGRGLMPKVTMAGDKQEPMGMFFDWVGPDTSFDSSWIFRFSDFTQDVYGARAGYRGWYSGMVQWALTGYWMCRVAQECYTLFDNDRRVL